MTFKCHSMSSNVHGTNRKLVYELLLVVYSNFRCITHRCRDTSCFNAENHIFAHHICIWHYIWRPCRWNAETKFGAKKLESWDCHMVKIEEIMIAGRGHSPRVWQTDRRTDRFTMTRTALCIALRSKNGQWLIKLITFFSILHQNSTT